MKLGRENGVDVNKDILPHCHQPFLYLFVDGKVLAGEIVGCVCLGGMGEDGGA